MYFLSFCLGRFALVTPLLEFAATGMPSHASRMRLDYVRLQGSNLAPCRPVTGDLRCIGNQICMCYPLSCVPFWLTCGFV
jgi:hypothetical protein